MFGRGKGGSICAPNKAVTEEECFDAAQEVRTASMPDLITYLNVGEWDHTPCGCFIWYNRNIDYKNPAVGNCKDIYGGGNLICTK
jgi:hypothetical protein